MKKNICVLALLLVGGIVAGFAAPADNFQAGGMEIGGDLNITYSPSYGIFNSEERELDGGEYNIYVEGSANIGWFVVDRLSLNLVPSVWMRQRRYYNSGQENKYTYLYLGLAAGVNYYLLPLKSLALSLGLNAGVMVIPGIDGIDNDLPESNDSLALQFALEPNLTCYWFAGEHLAPYLVLAPELNYLRGIRYTSGDKVTYSDDYSFLDDVYLQMRFKIGLKYFMPEGGRFQAKHKDYADTREDFGK